MTIKGLLFSVYIYNLVIGKLFEFFFTSTLCLDILGKNKKNYILSLSHLKKKKKNNVFRFMPRSIVLDCSAPIRNGGKRRICLDRNIV